MKKIIKICAGASALIAGCGAFAAKPVINTANAIETIPSAEVTKITNAQGEFAFKAINMPKTVNADVSEKLFIPYPSVSDSSYTIKVNVKDGNNVYTHTIGEAVPAGEETPFEVVKTGEDPDIVETGVNFSYYRNTTYKVYFTAEKDGKIYQSSIYDVNVEGVKYSYDVANIATKIPTIAGVGDKILLPTLTLLDANGNVVKNGNDPIVAIPEVEKNNNKVTVSDNGALRLESGKYYLYTQELGTYTVRYSTADYSVIPQEIDIDVESWFDSSKVELDVKSMSLSNVDLNVEKSLPEAKVSDITHTYNGSTEVPHNTVITILDEDGDIVDTLTGDEINSYTFSKTGTYSLEYKVSSLYLNNVKEATSYIKNVVVSDRTAPTVYMVEDYATKDGEGNPIENWEESIVKLDKSAIPSRVGWGKITLPAIYAEDNGSSYNQITFSRVVIAPDGKETKIDADITKAYEHSFTSEGKGIYTIEYRAVDAAGRSTPLSFKVEVTSDEALDYTEDTNLNITLPTINNEMYSDEVRTVKVDSATDDEDEAIETHYYFYFGDEDLFTTAYNSKKPADAEVAYKFSDLKTYFNTTNKLYDLTCEDNKLTIEIEEAYKEVYDALTDKSDMEDKFTVVAVAINDQGQFVYDTEVIGIKDATNDVTAPNMTMSGEFKSSYVLGEVDEVVLPIATFTDDAKDLSVFANYYIVDKNGEASELTEFSSYYVGNSIGGAISLTKAGTYYVVYTAVDDANNTYDYITSFNVTKKVSYRIDVEYTNVIDVFGSTEINAYVYDDENNKVETPVTIKFNNSASPKKSGTKYTFNEAGDYTFVASATVGEEEIKSGIMTIKVNELEYKWTNSAELKVAVDSTAVVGGTVNIKIPTYTYGNQTLPAEVKVIDPNGDEVEVTYVKVNGVIADATFEATIEGQYKTTFIAGEKESDPIYTYVGDTNRPTISIANKDSIPSEITYNDEDITLTISNSPTLIESESTNQYNVYKVTVKAKSESGEIFSRDIKVKLFDINGSGASVPLKWSDAIKNGSIKLNDKSSESSSSFKWTISSKGEYELTIVATDTNGRDSYEETISFKVVEKSGETEKKDNKAGIVLIIVAIILLAGIIGFFAFAGKSPKSKKIKPVKIEEKKEDEKDNQ